VDVSSLQGHADELTAQGQTLLYFARDGQRLWDFSAVADRVKKTSAAGHRPVSAAEGIRTVLLTGDSAAPPPTPSPLRWAWTRCIAEVLPEEKAHVVRSACRKKGEIVLMVGDGINDAPALTSGRCGLRHRQRQRHRHRIRRPHPDARRPGGRAPGHPPLPPHHPQYPAEPVLGLLLQHHLHPRGRRHPLSPPSASCSLP
jgi:hypothetical protein